MPQRKTPGTAQRTKSTGFAGVIGHVHPIAALQGQRRLGRLAHAYCLIGEEGVGKTSVARALAEELLLGPGQPPRLDVHPDFWIDDRDEAISIDEIRFKPERVAEAHDQSLQQFLSLKPFIAPARVAVLANAERMTEAAQNCLLKTLEEPPPNTVLVLTTPYPDHLLPTCLSRCQLLQLAPVPAAPLANWLRTAWHAKEGAEDLAALAHGRPGWAVRALADPARLAAAERWAAELPALAFADVDIILGYAVRFGQGPAADQRLVAGEALRAFTGWLRDALMVQAGLAEAPMSPSRRGALEQWVARVSPAHLRASLAAAQRTQLLIDQNVNPRLAMEVLLLDSRVPVPA
jgi:DNA polymerase III subunit delta'